MPPATCSYVKVFWVSRSRSCVDLIQKERLDQTSRYLIPSQLSSQRKNNQSSHQTRKIMVPRLLRTSHNQKVKRKKEEHRRRARTNSSQLNPSPAVLSKLVGSFVFQMSSLPII